MKKGFTLIELLVVVLIIGILAAIALPQYQTAIERSRATEALTQMNALRGSLERYHAQHEVFPSTNSFEVLDVDLPCIQETNGACTSYGGKYFTLTFVPAEDSDDDSVTITATRNSGVNYSLTTVITPTSSGAYTAVRHCLPAEDDDSATEYCDAITGGHTGSSDSF